MKFVERLKQKTKDNLGNRTPVIAFIGDSVTQGCFELFDQDGKMEVAFDGCNAYSEKVKKILGMLYPQAPVATVNFGVEGDSATDGVKRFRRDVQSCKPDLLVVCFGLNDSNEDEKGIPAYKAALKEIFSEATKAGIETIFMTPNMINTYTNKRLVLKFLWPLGDVFAKRQLEGTFDAYMEAAREACEEENIRLCDCYAIWKQMYACGVDTTALLANGLNHPIREMHDLFAWQIVMTILS